MRRLQFGQTVFRHRDRYFFFGVARQTHHGLSGGHHLSGFRFHGGDHPRAVRRQHRVGALIVCHVQLRLRLIETRLGDIQRRFAFVDVGAADEFFLIQIVIARVIGLRLHHIGLRRRELAAHTGRVQLQVTRVYARERRSRLDHCAHIHQPLGDLAADAKTQR